MANLPEYTAGVPADSFSVQLKSPRSPEAEQIFRSAEQAQAMANQAGAKAEVAMEQYGADKGAATLVYEQQPDGTTALRPLDQMLAWNVGAGNRAYNAAVMRNYGAAVETEARATFGRLQLQYANDPTGYAVASRAYVDTTTQAMPERVRGQVNTQLNVLSSTFGTALHERVFRVQREQTYAVGIAGVLDIQRDAANLAQAGDPVRANQRLQQLETSLRSLAVEHPDRLTEVQIRATLREAQVDITASTLSNQALRAGGISGAEALVRRWSETGIIPPAARRQEAVPGGGTWQPPQQSLIPPATPEDERQARALASRLGGTMRAEPGAPIDSQGRPILYNRDGTVSTERNIGVTDPRLNNNRPTNIPSIQEGQQLSPRQAIEYAIRSGQTYPSFDTQAQADEAAVTRHHQLEAAGAGRPAQQAPGGGGTAAALQQFTPQERQVIAQRALGVARDIEHERQLNRSLAEQSTSDARQAAQRQYNILSQSPTIQTPQDRAVLAQRVQQSITNPQAAADFAGAITNPARAAELEARRQQDVIDAREDAARAAAAQTAASQRANDHITAGRIELRGETSPERIERRAGEIAFEAAAPNWPDRSSRVSAPTWQNPDAPTLERGMSASGAQAAPQPEFDQRVFNQVYDALSAPARAITAARVQAEQAGVESLNMLDVHHRNAAASAGEQPIPYRYVHMMQTLPPDQWDNAARTLEHEHDQRMEALRTLRLAQGAIAARTNPAEQTVVPQAQVDTVLANQPGDPASPSVRREVDLTNFRDPQSAHDIQTAAQIQQQAGTIGTKYMAQIDIGLAPTANLHAAENAVVLMQALLSDPLARPQMEFLLGERIARINRNADEIAVIQADANNESQDPAVRRGKMEEAWQRVQTARAAMARQPSTDRDNINQQLLNTTDIDGARIALLGNRIGAMQSETQDPEFSGLEGSLVRMIFDTRRAPGTVGTGSPDTPEWLQGGYNTFNNFMMFGERGVPIGTSRGEIPQAAVTLYKRVWDENVAQGVRDTQQLDDLSWAAVNRRFKPSVLSTQSRDRAVLVEGGGPEGAGFRLYGHSPTVIAGQLADFQERYLADARAAGHTVELRTPNGLQAVQNGDLYVRQVPGTDSDPRYVVYARQAGVVGNHVPLFYLPRMTRTAVDYDVRDQALFRIRPSPTAVMERQREQSLDVRSQNFVNTEIPGLPTGLHNNVVGFMRMWMSHGIEPYSPAAGAARMERRGAAQQAAPPPAPAAAAPPPAAAPTAAAPPAEDPITGFRPRGGR